MTYKEQLKHPKWQKKRLEIMSRDKWTCRACGNMDNMLQVHHLYYMPNNKAWEYDNEAYVTLCWECHEQITKDLAKLAGIIAFKILSKDIDFFNMGNYATYPHLPPLYTSIEKDLKKTENILQEI
jgi:hypothetical protein